MIASLFDLLFRYFSFHNGKISKSLHKLTNFSHRIIIGGVTFNSSSCDSSLGACAGERGDFEFTIELSLYT